MGQFFASLPRKILATVVIVVGTIVIIALNPPTTVCDAQFKVFVKSQVKNLFNDPSRINQPQKVVFGYAMDRCKETNTPGGCHGFFESLSSITRDLKNIPRNCVEDFSKRAVIEKVIWKSLELITRLAWGENPPGTYRDAAGWLSPPDLAIFCGLKDVVISFYGIGRYGEFSKAVGVDLPGAKELGYKETWTRMILSYNCN